MVLFRSGDSGENHALGVCGCRESQFICVAFRSTPVPAFLDGIPFSLVGGSGEPDIEGFGIETVEHVLCILGRYVEIGKDRHLVIDIKRIKSYQVQHIAGEVVFEVAGERAAAVEFPVLHAGQVEVRIVQCDRGLDRGRLVVLGLDAVLDLDLAEGADIGAVELSLKSHERILERALRNHVPR